jgi:hypothetical protein
MPTNRSGPTVCESHAKRPTGSGSPRARTTHSMMAPSVFEQVPVVLSTRIVRNPKSTRRPPRGSLDSRSTAWPWWPSEWAWSLLLSARCPAQPCHPQLPAGRSLGTAGAIVEVSHDRKQLRSSPGVSPLSRWLAESVAGWRTAWLLGRRGRQCVGGSRFRCTHSRTSPAVASSGRRSANSRTPRIERWQIASSTAL